MWPVNAKGYRSINGKIVAQSAKKIANDAGISVNDHIQVLLVEGAKDIENDFYSQEKLSPVLTVFKYDTFEKGFEILVRLTDNYGTGHSCGIHTKNQTYINHLGEYMRTSRIIGESSTSACKWWCIL